MIHSATKILKTTFKPGNQTRQLIRNFESIKLGQAKDNEFLLCSDKDKITTYGLYIFHLVVFSFDALGNRLRLAATFLVVESNQAIVPRCKHCLSSSSFGNLMSDITSIARDIGCIFKRDSNTVRLKFLIYCLDIDMKERERGDKESQKEAHQLSSSTEN